MNKIEQLRKRIKRTNAQFMAMPTAQQRVQLARDVLALMAATRIKPTFGDFGALKLKEDDLDKQLNEVLGACRPCAVGGLFIAAVDRYDRLKCKDLSDIASVKYGLTVDVDEKDFLPYLKRWFSEAQIKLIETAFEKGHGAYHGEDHPAARFAPRLKTARGRLTAIMENIIANEGTFKPVANGK